MFSKLATSRVAVSALRRSVSTVTNSQRLVVRAGAPVWRNNSQFARAFSKTPVEEADIVEETTDAKVDPKTTAADDDVEVELDEEVENDADSAAPVAAEKPSGEASTHSFQAETRRILDIVANSLYTDKEVFLREIISNASDALEKARYLQLTNEELVESDKPLELKIYTNERENTLIIQDSGIGMTKEELIENLGTIARSGTKAFVEAAAGDEGGDASNMIGQFGVGFYSLFMVADKVEVYSLSAKREGVAQAHYWSSDGTGEYDLREAEGVSRGTKIIVHLKENAKNYAIKHVIEGVVKKYSNFVGFPISLNETKLNTVQALWAMDKSSITEDQHLEFYRYIANAYDNPFFKMHFTTDAPLEIKALFYFPERHMEKYGMGRSEPGVSLYCRKVLIQHKCTTILPEWLRFVKGVVDSEDIPLNISRENMQDSGLIQRMNTVLTKRVIKFLAERARKESEQYMKFWAEFGNFLKEGVCSDFQHKGDIAQLLRFDTSLGEKEMCSLDDYVSRMPVEQDEIYYLCAPSRDFALSSPYFESFDKDGIEVLFLYSHIDDFVMKNLERYNKRKVVSIESANVKAINKAAPAAEDGKEDAKEENLSTSDEEGLTKFFQDTLASKVTSVKITTRLSNSPAIVVDHESAAVRKMMKYVEATGHNELPKQKLEINAKHPTMVKIASLRSTDPKLAKLVAEQIFDNALIAADILDNPRSMLARLNKILEHTCDSK